MVRVRARVRVGVRVSHSAWSPAICTAMPPRTEPEEGVGARAPEGEDGRPPVFAPSRRAQHSRATALPRQSCE